MYNNVWHLLDDFIFVSEPHSRQPGYSLNSFVSLSKEPNIPIKESKTYRSTTNVSVVGIEVDTICR